MRVQYQNRRFRALRTIVALILREMSTTYGRSAGGYIWAVIEPAAGIALLAFAFSLALRAPSLGTNFALFYATGYLPYMLYFHSAKKVSNSLKFSRPLLKYPGVTYVDAFVARGVLNLLTYCMIFIIVIGGITSIFRTGAYVDPISICLSLFLAGALGFSVGVMNCFLFSVFGVWERIWNIMNRPLFILSTVLFTIEDVPEDFRVWLWLNPLTHIVGEMRTGFYPYYQGAYVSNVYVVYWILITLLIGLMFMRLYHWKILNE